MKRTKEFHFRNHGEFNKKSIKNVSGKGSGTMAFTLVELLVVVSIVLLLLSLMFPSLKRARDMGRQAACISNLKQIGGAAHMYAADNNDVLPPYNLPPPGTGFWWNTLKKYTNDKSADYGALIQCGVATASDSYGNFRTCYGLNSSQSDVCLFNMRKTAECVFIADARYPYFNYITETVSMSNYMSFRHASGVNLLYVDGHASWRKLPCPASGNSEYYPFWFGQ